MLRSQRGSTGWKADLCVQSSGESTRSFATGRAAVICIQHTAHEAKWEPPGTSDVRIGALEWLRGKMEYDGFTETAFDQILQNSKRVLILLLIYAYTLLYNTKQNIFPIVQLKSLY